MITIDKVTYRNLQEQVQKNKNDIEAWTNIQFTLNNMGITVLGRVDASVDIPVKSYEYGDAYLVGTSDPYDIYIYTRTTDPNVHGTFINLGPLSIAGPQGPKGDQGKDGVDGYAPVVRYGNGMPIVEATDKNGYLYIDQQTSNLYTYNNGWNFVINMKGPQGPQGIQGVQGATGTSLSIVSKLSSPTLLPTDFSSGQIPKNSAYLVDVNGVNHLYIIIGDQADYSTWYWQDAGDFNLGSVIYKDEVFQSSINVTDNYNTNTGAIVTDTATNNMNNDLNSKIGDLEILATTDKSTLVNAINEVKNSSGSGGDSLPSISELNNFVNNNATVEFFNSTGTILNKEFYFGYKNGVISMYGRFVFKITNRQKENPGIWVILPNIGVQLPNWKLFSFVQAFQVSNNYDSSQIIGIRPAYLRLNAENNSFIISLTESNTNVQNGSIYSVTIPLTYVKL